MRLVHADNFLHESSVGLNLLISRKSTERLGRTSDLAYSLTLEGYYSGNMG
jgi:hypothetical protein